MQELLNELRAMKSELRVKAIASDSESTKRAYNGTANKLRLLIDKYSK